MKRLAFVILLISGCAGNGGPGTLRVTISENARSSVEPTPAYFPIATGAKDTGAGIYQFDAQLDRDGGGHRLVIVNIHDAPGTPPTAAHSYVAEAPPVGGPFLAGHAIVTLTDVPVDQRNLSSWQSTSGSVTIAAVDGERVSVHFDATMDVAPYTSGQGSFHVSGDCTVEKLSEGSFLTGSP